MLANVVEAVGQLGRVGCGYKAFLGAEAVGVYVYFFFFAPQDVTCRADWDALSVVDPAQKFVLFVDGAGPQRVFLFVEEEVEEGKEEDGGCEEKEAHHVEIELRPVVAFLDEVAKDAG